MKRSWLTRLCFTGLCCTGLGGAGLAGATELNFRVTYPLGAGVGVSGYSALGGQLAGGVSTRAVEASYSRGWSLAPLGALTTTSCVRYAWGGGYRLESGASGALGPVALNLSGDYFTAAATAFDPLAAWALEATDLRERGWNAGLGVRYRVSRQVIAVLGSELGGQWNVYGGAEFRRELTRTLPRAEGDDPAAPLETERTGELTYRVGARAGRNVLGATAGITYSTPGGRSLSLDAQLGPTRQGVLGLGLIASASFAEVLGANSVLSTYAAYEPWRQNANPLRAGIEVIKPVGSGTLRVDLRGGRNVAGQAGFGAALGYTLALGSGDQSTEALSEPAGEAESAQP